MIPSLQTTVDGRAATASLARPADPATARAILSFIAVCALAKAGAALATGFTGDEAYTVVMARTLALSYFDHPPLHQWILHAATRLLGEGPIARLPFFVMALAINLPLHGLTRRLYGQAAALWALFAFNAVAYFVVWPDGLILPDVPLLLCLATAIWAVAEILFGPEPSQTGQVAWWLAAGLAFGGAGLAKYSAVLAVVGLFGFLACSRRHRHWLWHPMPYLGAILALAIFAPAAIWNAENHFASFRFQSGRIATGLTFDGHVIKDIFQALGAQVALLTPWVGFPLVMALVTAAGSRDADGGDRFLLWLVGVPIVLFTVMPVFGERALPHWYNSGWLFAMPLVGQWLSAKSGAWLRLWAGASAALAVLSLVGYVVFVSAGPFWQSRESASRPHDPTEWSYDWTGLTALPAWTAAGIAPPAFVVVDRWRVGGKAGVALGAGVPVCAFADDPRGFVFQCEQAALMGKDAMIVALKDGSEAYLASLAPYFERLEPSQEMAVGRMGRREQIITLTRAHKLLRAYPSPFGKDGP